MTTKAVEDLMHRYELAKAAKDPDLKTNKIHVDEIASKMAVFYEQIRSLIDYQEEHLLRKNFIGRILRRRLILKNISKDISEPLIKEVIRAGYLPNDSVPESKVDEIQRIIDNFFKIAEAIRSSKGSRKDEAYDWLVKITTSAVEENLFPPIKDRMLSEFMFWTIRENLSVTGVDLKEEEIDLQLFIAIQKALLRVDEDQLNYRLLKFTYPDWNNPETDKTEIAENLITIKDRLAEHRHHKASKYFYQLCNKYNTVFYLIGDILDKNLSIDELKEVFNDEKLFGKEITASYKERYNKQKSKLNRIAFFSVISIFLSKILVALAIEVPIDMYITDDFSFLNLIINIIAPAILMLIIIASIKMPSDDNIDIVVEEAEAVVGLKESKNYSVTVPRKKSLFTTLLLRTLYLVIFFYSFYYLTQILLLVDFSWTNIIIFAFFISLVAATGIKVHNRSKEISMEERQPKFIMFLIDIFALPFISVGRWGLAALSKMNLLVFFFNLIIELPFQIIISLVENFRSFIKGQKEDLH